MATKNISITEEAYNRLARLRKGNESFTEIIVRVTKKNNWRDFVGVLSEEKADLIEKSINEGRRIHRKLHEERHKRLMKEMQ